MPGINLGVMGGVKATAGNGFSSVPGGSATEMAFGPGYTQAGMPSTGETFKPNDPFGIAFWAGVTAVVLLVLIRQSLPA